MKKLLFIPLAGLILATSYSCKKATIKRNIDGYWVATKVSLNGNEIPVDQQYTNKDSLDWSMIRDVRFFQKVKQQLDPTKSKEDIIYKGYFEGTVVKPDSVGVNTVVSGVMFYFDYDVAKKDEIDLSSINYGDFPMVKKSLPTKINADIDFKKNKMTLTLPVGSNKYSYTFERRND